MTTPSEAARLSTGATAGYCHFERRTYTLRQRAAMALADVGMAAARAALRLGGAPLRRGLISAVSGLCHRLLARRRRIILTNLDLVYGDALSEERKLALARRVWRHLARAGLDFLFDDVYWPPEKVLAAVRATGAEALDAARAEGRGVAILAGHGGPWELGMRVITGFGYPTVGIYKGFRSPWFDRLMARKRIRHGFGLVEVPRQEFATVDGERRPLPRRSIRPELEALWKDNQCVAIAIDQYARRGCLEIPFLGVPDTPTPVGALRYAVENKIPLTFQSCAYGPDDTILWRVEGPIFIEDQPGGLEATMEHYLRMASRWVGERILEHPEQYIWGHRRFPRHYYDRPRPVRRDPPKPREARPGLGPEED